jgi:hypothetical protein
MKPFLEKLMIRSTNDRKTLERGVQCTCAGTMGPCGFDSGLSFSEVPITDRGQTVPSRRLCQNRICTTDPRCQLENEAGPETLIDTNTAAIYGPTQRLYKSRGADSGHAHSTRCVRRATGVASEKNTTCTPDCSSGSLAKTQPSEPIQSQVD